MEQINISTLDSPIFEETQFGENMQNWLSNTVDILNSLIIAFDGFVNNVIEISTFDAGGFGVGPVSVPVLGLTTNGSVLVRLLSSTNPAEIINIVPLTNQFTVTFSADPGASAIITYQAFSSDPQG